jgi:hypothetical protein
MDTAEALGVRVWVEDVWDVVNIPVTPEWSVARLKEEALHRATGRSLDPAHYEVKFRGGKILDESRTLGDLAVPNQAAFIVLSVRRRPVS